MSGHYRILSFGKDFVSPFPFREGQKNISFCVPLQEGQLWYNGSKFDQ